MIKNIVIKRYVLTDEQRALALQCNIDLSELDRTSSCACDYCEASNEDQYRNIMIKLICHRRYIYRATLYANDEIFSYMSFPLTLWDYETTLLALYDTHSIADLEQDYRLWAEN